MSIGIFQVVGLPFAGKHSCNIVKNRYNVFVFFLTTSNRILKKTLVICAHWPLVYLGNWSNYPTALVYF